MSYPTDATNTRTYANHIALGIIRTVRRIRNTPVLKRSRSLRIRSHHSAQRDFYSQLKNKMKQRIKITPKRETYTLSTSKIQNRRSAT